MGRGAGLLLGVFIVTLVLTGLIRHAALRHGILDNPNERSSHSIPTPRGGGLAIVVSTMLAIFGLYSMHRVDFALAAALLGGGLLIAIVGFLDDRGLLPVGARFAVHIVSAIWAVYEIGGLPPLRIGVHLVSLGFLGNLATVIAIVWTLNLFNFMDGIDGIAASEAVFISAAGGIIALVFQHDGAVAHSALVIAAASLAFLCWNWPPAKIFMGDVGSGYLGYVIAVVGLAAGRSSSVAVMIWLILGGVFFVDATITLAFRVARGQRIYQAHRDHLYQKLVVHWQGHAPVTILVCSMNILLLLPLAVWSAIHEELAAPLAAATILCLSGLMILARLAMPPRVPTAIPNARDD